MEGYYHHQQGLIPGLPDDIAMDCLIKVPHRYHSGLRLVCQTWRSLVSSSSFYSNRRLFGAAESLVSLIQAHNAESSMAGKNKAWAPPTYGLTLYNPAADSWYRHPGITVPIFAQFVAVADKIILLGGWDSTTLDATCDVHVVDGITGDCRRGKPMSTARSFFACAAVGSVVYIAGGHDNQKNALKTAELYDPVTDEWQTLPSMAEERDECQGVSIGGKFLVISGYNTDNQGSFVRGGECFDPVTWNWKKEEDGLWGDTELPIVDSPRSVCFVLPNSGNSKEEDKLWHLECNGLRRGIKEFDGELKRWKVVADIPDNLRSSPFVTVIRGNRDDDALQVFLVGCEPSDGEQIHGAWLMDVKTKKWRQLSIPVGFSGFAYSPASLCI